MRPQVHLRHLKESQIVQSAQHSAAPIDADGQIFKSSESTVLSPFEILATYLGA